MRRRPLLRMLDALLALCLLSLLAACIGGEGEDTVLGSDAEAGDSQPDATLGPTTTSDPSSGSDRGAEAPRRRNRGDDSSGASDGTATGSSGVLGVVGCSNTAQSVFGYHESSSIGKLTAGALGGGSVSMWGEPSGSRHDGYWGEYESRRPVDGYEGAWVQLCIKTDEHEGGFDGSEQEWVSHIVGQIHALDPGIPIWISPLNFYEGFVCQRVGPDGPAIAAEASDWAAATFPNVHRGPDLGPLRLEHIADDLCHPNFEGRLFVGKQLVAFFDQAPH